LQQNNGKYIQSKATWEASTRCDGLPAGWHVLERAVQRNAIANKLQRPRLKKAPPSHHCQRIGFAPGTALAVPLKARFRPETPSCRKSPVGLVLPVPGGAGVGSVMLVRLTRSV